MTPFAPPSRRVAMSGVFLPLATACLLAAGCATAPRGTVYQVSTIDALLAGVYTGETPMGDVLRHGDLGLGTLEGLDGELVVLDGRAWCACIDGRVAAVRDDARTPFCTVVPFAPTVRTAPIEAASLDALTAALDRVLPRGDNGLYAVRMDGVFETLKVRSVPRQQPPYRPLAEVVHDQRVWERHDVRGTLLGFRCPPWMKGVAITGWHLHALSDDRAVGGHVLDVRLRGLSAAIEACDGIDVRLPQGAAFAAADLRRDRSAEARRVEK